MACWLRELSLFRNRISLECVVNWVDVHVDGGPVVESNQYSLASRVGLKMGRRYCRKRVLGRAAHHHFPRPGELSTDLDKPTNPTDDPKGTLHITEPVDIPASASIAPSRRPCDHTARPALHPATYRHTRYQRSSSFIRFLRVNTECRREWYLSWESRGRCCGVEMSHCRLDTEQRLTDTEQQSSVTSKHGVSMLAPPTPTHHS
jgi:hypothetical protein